jgi:hypothetical protein
MDPRRASWRRLYYSEKSSIVTLYRKCAGALTFENVWQAASHAGALTWHTRVVAGRLRTCLEALGFRPKP